MPVDIGKYRLQDAPLARDAFGVLSEAIDLETNQPVLVKAMHALAAKNEPASAIQPLQGLLHPALLPAFDEVVLKNRRYIIAPRPEGELLQTALPRLRAEGLRGRHRLLSIILEVSKALELLHRSGLASGQVHPASIFINTTEPPQTYLLCFGALTHHPAVQYIEGNDTLLYVPQDQLRGGGDFHSDIYALGMLLNQCLGSGSPFTAEDPYRLAEQIMWGDFAPFSPGVDGMNDAQAQAISMEMDAVGAVVANALQRDPKSRYPNLNAMRMALEPIADRLAPIELGARLLAAGQFDQSAAVLETVVNTPDAPRAYVYLGEIYGFHQGDYEKGVVAFKRALKHDPSLAVARLNLARLYSRFDRHTLAQKTLLELLEQHPNDRLLMLEYADVLRASGDPSGALNILRRLLEINPYDLPPYIKAISLALAVNDFKQAETFCQQAVEQILQVVHLGNLDKQQVSEIYYLRGVLQRRQGRQERALAWMGKALDYDPFNPRAHTAMAELYTELGDVEKALEHFLTGMSIAPDQKGIMEGLARILESQKNAPPAQDQQVTDD